MGDLSHKDVTDLVICYQETGSKEALDKIVRQYENLVFSIARRFLATGVPLEDLSQVGYIGLLGAIKRFDPERGFVLMTFAVPNIIGEIKRYCRDKHVMVRTPRDLYYLELKVQAAREELKSEGRPNPTLDELSKYIGESIEEISLAICSKRGIMSLDAPTWEDDDATAHDIIDANSPGLETFLSRTDLSKLFERLTERERWIIYQRFYLDASQSQIAANVGVSQMHISRIIEKVLKKMAASPEDLVLDALKKRAQSRETLQSWTGLNGDLDPAIVSLLFSRKIKSVRRGNAPGRDIFALARGRKG